MEIVKCARSAREKNTLTRGKRKNWPRIHDKRQEEEEEELEEILLKKSLSLSRCKRRFPTLHPLKALALPKSPPSLFLTLWITHWSHSPCVGGSPGTLEDRHWGTRLLNPFAGGSYTIPPEDRVANFQVSSGTVVVVGLQSTRDPRSSGGLIQETHSTR